ncbi:MAG: hypothetical protein ACOY16_11665 [Chloroflexota bacterium]
MYWRKIFSLSGYLLICILSLGASVLPPGNPIERVRAFTRQIEFDYIAWTGNAVGIKLSQTATRSALFLDPAGQRQQVIDYLILLFQIQDLDSQLNRIYADPSVENPQQASRQIRRQLDKLKNKRAEAAPLVEGILEMQLSQTIAEMGLSLAGQPIPPVSFHVSPVPSSLIVSPREVIRQDANISLMADFTVDQMAQLEDQVDKALNVSSLVVPVGGIGVYPTMVMETTDLNWLAEVVAHEWTHNFLTFRPLGVNYTTSPELRTMNETAASIAGKELGHALIARYYPELLPPPPVEPPSTDEPQPPPEPPAFDFRKEMHQTRITVDQLLVEGKIEQAEAYMEQRRRVFWEHGYLIRKLNQAYFAFHGAYADEAVGAAGKDPIGEAVRNLRARSPNLASFLNQISWMWSPQQLMDAVHEP